MRSRHFMKLLDTTGSLVAIVDDFEYMKYSHKVNDAGYLQVQVRGGHKIETLSGTDYICEVWRSVPDVGIDWYLEGCYFVRSRVNQGFSNGREIFTLYGPGFVDLLRRRCILYYANSDFTDKSGPGETVMKAFVNENAGPAATIALGRLSDGVTLGLSVQADGAAGTTWTGRRAYDNLLDVCQDISLATGIYFDIVPAGVAQFLFRTYENLRGTDRRQTGIDPATGLNAAGNPPIVFSLSLGNMEGPVYSINYDEMANVIVALGQGVEDARAFVVVTDPVTLAQSPWNRVELTRNSNMEYSNAGLTAVADAALENKMAVSKFNFNIIQTPTSLYGYHYTWGDYVTAQYKGNNRDVFINKVTVTSSERENESIDFELSDVP